MKRQIILLCMVVVLLLSACDTNFQYKQKAELYYPADKITYGTNEEYLQKTYCECFQRTTEDILAEYLLGPTEPGLKDPFPDGVVIMSLKQKNDHITIVLNSKFAELSGIDLTTACVCLAKTTMGLTDTSSVTISCETQFSDGGQSITITQDSVLLTDDHTEPTAYITESTTTND